MNGATHQTPAMPPRHMVAYATASIQICLDSISGGDNYERAALREALVYLQMGDVLNAVDVLAAAIRHAFRPEFAEDRVEVVAACVAFALLAVEEKGAI